MSQYLSEPSVVADAYADLRTRVTKLLTGLPAEKAGARSAHCPAWTVKDVLAHMVGVPEDILAGNLEGVATDAWTQRQVERHATDSIDDLLAIWAELDSTLNGLVPNLPNPTVSQLLFDQVQHEHDMRHALDMPGDRDSAAVAVGEGFVRFFLSQDKRPEVVALADSPVKGFEFIRSIGGRRSAEQIAAAGLDVEAVTTFLSNALFSLPSETVGD